MFDVLTVGVIGALVLSARKQHVSKHGIMTAERQEMFNSAMENLADAEKLRKLAKVFDEHGLKVQGNLLRRRATWRSRKTELRDQHDTIFEKAMASTNVPGILKVAASFEAMTATHRAQMLRDHAQRLQSIPRNTPPKEVETTAEPAATEEDTK